MGQISPKMKSREFSISIIFSDTHVHQYVSENVIKIFGDFGAIFWKKAWAIIVQCIFQKLADFLKWS